MASYDQEAMAVGLRRQNKSERAIAKEMGISASTVRRLIKRAVDRSVGQPTRDWLKESLEHLDKAIKGLAASGAYDGDPKAVGALVKALERVSKLKGLDAPTKVKVENVDLARVPMGELLYLARELGIVSDGK